MFSYYWASLTDERRTYELFETVCELVPGMAVIASNIPTGIAVIVPIVLPTGVMQIYMDFEALLKGDKKSIRDFHYM